MSGQLNLFAPPLVWGIAQTNLEPGQLVRLDLTGELLVGEKLFPNVPPRVCVVGTLPGGSRYVERGDLDDWLPEQRKAWQELDALSSRLDEAADMGPLASYWHERVRQANYSDVSPWALMTLVPFERPEKPPSKRKKRPKKKRRSAS